MSRLYGSLSPFNNSFRASHGRHGRPSAKIFMQKLSSAKRFAQTTTNVLIVYVFFFSAGISPQSPATARGSSNFNNPTIDFCATRAVVSDLATWRRRQRFYAGMRKIPKRDLAFFQFAYRDVGQPSNVGQRVMFLPGERVNVTKPRSLSSPLVNSRQTLYLV